MRDKSICRHPPVYSILKEKPWILLECDAKDVVKSNQELVLKEGKKQPLLTQFVVSQLLASRRLNLKAFMQGQGNPSDK